MEPHSQDRPSRIAFREKLAASVETFHGTQHDEKDHAGKNGGTGGADFSVWEEAQKSAVDVVPSTHRGKFWLNAEGKFVRPPGKVQVHIAVIPQQMQTPRGPDYKAFAHATKAIRIVVSPYESTVHMWEPPNGAQRDAIEQLIRQTTHLQGDRDDGSHYNIQYLNGSAEGKIHGGVARVVRFIEGEIEPKSERYEFKGQIGMEDMVDDEN